MSDDFQSQQQRLAAAVGAARTAHTTHVAVASRAADTAAAQQAAAEAARANGRRWAAAELAALGAAVADGRERAPREVAATAPSPNPSQWEGDLAPSPAGGVVGSGDSRAGLQAAHRQAQAALAGIHEGGRALLLWQARRSSILGGAAIALLALLALGAALIFRQVRQAQAEAATATQAVIVAQQNAVATSAVGTATAAAAVAQTTSAAGAATTNALLTQTATAGAVARTATAAVATDTPAATSTRRATSTPPPSNTPSPSHTPAPTSAAPETLLVGRTALGTPIEAVRFGRGPRAIIFIGGLHAGFAPGTVALARQAVDHFTAHPEQVPAGASLYVIVSASPDTAPAPGELAGRLNSNGVDANRNWDCSWAADARWRNEVVPGSGGAAPFSEPEVAALADFIVSRDAAAVVFFEALVRDGLVSPGNCGRLPAVSQPLADVYGAAAGYPIEDFEEFAEQVINGDGANWLDAEGIPAIAILLPRYDTTDWAANLRGMQAVLEAYGR